MSPLNFSNVSELNQRGLIRYIHNGELSASSAFEIEEKGSIRILLPRHLGVVSAFLNVFCEDCKVDKITVFGEWCGIEKEFDVYEFNLDMEKIGAGLYYFKIVMNTVCGEIIGSKNGEYIRFSSANSNISLFQVSISDFKYNAPTQKYGGIIYHIFVDRFKKGGKVKKKKDAVIADYSKGIPEYPAYPGAPLKNNTFYGGTLYGIIDELDYIKSLGVDTIYLSPIFDSVSNHKYDTGDYMTVDSMFGGDEALKLLIKKAKEKSIDIILDGVFNHTGSDSLYFNRYGKYNSIGAYQSKDSKFYSWYDFQEYPDKYTCWWGINILPRINPDKAQVSEYFVGENGVIDKYSKLGVLGFRLDVVDELSDDFVSKIKYRLNKNNKSSVLFGEVWEDASNKIAYGKRKKYYLGQELDGVMNYPFRTGIIDFITKGDIRALNYALTDIVNNAPKRIRNMQMNLLGTHDTERILTLLGGESSDGKDNDYLATKRMTKNERSFARKKLLMAYTILATLPGIPTIFYGDEVGLEGYHDPFNRMPYPWGNEDKVILNHYRKIGKIRRENSVYKEGDFKLVALDKDFLCFARTCDKYAFVTFVNNSNETVELEFSEVCECLTSSETSNNLFVEFYLQGQDSQIFKMKNGTKIFIRK